MKYSRKYSAMRVATFSKAGPSGTLLPPDSACISSRTISPSRRRASFGGLHFQKTHPQGKLVRVIEGEVFDVAVDIRAGSKTYGKWHAVTLTAEKNNMFYIPEGFAHGFLVLSDTAIFTYKCTDFYHPEDEGGLLWNDPAIAIAWPDIGMEPLLSEKDMKHPGLKEISK